MIWLTINFITQFFGCVQCEVQREKGTGTVLSKKLENGEYMDCFCSNYSNENYERLKTDVQCYVYDGTSGACGSSVRIYGVNSLEENLFLEFYKNKKEKHFVYTFSDEEVQTMQGCLPDPHDTAE